VLKNAKSIQLHRRRWKPATRDKFFHNCGEPIRENMPEFTASESDEPDEESDHGHDDG
jgi:hypothetical protein